MPSFEHAEIVLDRIGMDHGAPFLIADVLPFTMVYAGMAREVA